MQYISSQLIRLEINVRGDCLNTFDFAGMLPEPRAHNVERILDGFLIVFVSQDGVSLLDNHLANTAERGSLGFHLRLHLHFRNRGTILDFAANL